MDLKLYVVRNNGKYYKTGVKHWVDDITKAKIFNKISGAKSTVTYWARHYPTYGVPQIIELIVSESNVLEQSARVEKANEAKSRREKKRVIETARRAAERA